MAGVAGSAVFESVARTDLDLAYRLAVYGHVEEDAMRDGHVWCIGSAREREEACKKGGTHMAADASCCARAAGDKFGGLTLWLRHALTRPLKCLP